jgi:transmembrane sensor
LEKLYPHHQNTLTKLKEEDIRIIEKYIAGIASEEENKLVESFFTSGEDKTEMKRLLEKEWNQISNEYPDNSLKLSQLLDHIHHLIRNYEYEKGNTVLRKVVNIYIKVAAILILPLIITAVIGYSNLKENISSSVQSVKEDVRKESATSTIIAPFGSRVAFSLPDSTTGMLNSGSRLTYTIPFSGNRNIKLEGEAWFDVKFNKSCPFVITAGNSTVKVLGTSFNINAYPAENYVEVVLSKGKVEFSDKYNNSKVTMFPSERLIFQNGDISKSVTEPAKYSGWTEGKLVFRGDLMSEVGRRIERWYNVKFELADRELEKYSFRGTFEDDTLEEVLDLLSMTSPIRYKIRPRKINADGTYEKEKVTIYLKK